MKTLVYFDIEATGLKSSGRPRISEISFVAINNQEILNLNHTLLEKLNDMKSSEQILHLETFLPRVLNKLAHLMCLSYGYYNARGIQTYRFRQL